MRASVVEIQATRGIPKLGVGELWRFRDLIYFFAWRDVKVRYKQTLLGGWPSCFVLPTSPGIVFTSWDIDSGLMGSHNPSLEPISRRGPFRRRS
jgi:hypothetical protein